MKPVKVLYLALICSAMILLLNLNAYGQAKVTKESFGKTSDGQDADIYTLTNSGGAEVKITNYGGIITSLKVPDRNGKLDDIVLGFDNLDAYLKGHPYFGAIIGRFGNRIAKGRFTLHGVEYKLAVNNGENHLHGGIKGFDRVVWNAKPLEELKNVGLELTYLSKDGEEGYPGNLSVKVVSGSIPTGELKSVAGTPFDFTHMTAIGARIDQDDEQLKFGKCYDHNFVLKQKRCIVPSYIVSCTFRRAAKVYEPTSGRVMEVWTDQPGIQFYTGNFLDGTLTGKNGKTYQRRSGFCLETQHYPDSPNKPNFPSTILRKGWE